MHVPAASLLSVFLLAPVMDGWLGVYLEDDPAGPVIVEVIPDSPAAKAGLRAGDRLLGVGERATASHAEFVQAIRAAKVGEAVAIRLRRGEQELTVQVVLATRPEVAPPMQANAQPMRGDKPAPAAEPGRTQTGSGRGYLGLAVREADGGVVIDRVIESGPAAQAGLLAGERIQRIDDVAIGGLRDLERALQGKAAGRRVTFHVVGSASRHVVVALGNQDVPAAAPQAMTVAPVEPLPARTSGPGAGTNSGAPATSPAVEEELRALRAELAELRRQLEALRRGGRKE